MKPMNLSVLFGTAFLSCMCPVLLFSNESDLLYRKEDPIAIEVRFAEGLLNRGLLHDAERKGFALLDQKNNIKKELCWKTGSLLLNLLGQQWFSAPASDRKIIDEKIDRVRQMLEDIPAGSSGEMQERLFYFYTLSQLCVARGTILRVEGDPGVSSDRYFRELLQLIERAEKSSGFSESERFLFSCYRDLSLQDWGFKRDDPVLQKRIAENAEKLKAMIPKEVAFQKTSQNNFSVMSDSLPEMENKAKTAWDQNHWKEAVALYDQAASLARQQGDRKKAFQLRGTAAGILDQQYRKPVSLSAENLIAIKKDLANRFFFLGMDFPDEPLSEKLGEYGLHYAQELFQKGDLSWNTYAQWRMDWEKRISNPADRDLFRLNTVLLLLNHSGKEKAIDFLLNGQNGKQIQSDQISQMILDRLQTIHSSVGDHAIFHSAELLFLQAEAFRGTGQFQNALNLYAQLLKKSPDDLRACTAIAEILSEQNDDQGLRKALIFWEKTADLSARGSDPWWKAKENIFLLLCRLNEKIRAQKFIELLELTEPDLGGEVQKKQFYEIRQKFFK
ncbi:MAG: tetratricopeptide repeat protein [Planctomycetia bacterium]|nr:tetratricopeptide repeat protein [Planctomycetia bacterium]